MQSEASDHPNAPKRVHLALAFLAIVSAGLLGGAIGWGIVDTTCHEAPTTADALLSDFPGYEVDTDSCDTVLIAGALAGSIPAAVGAGIVAMLMLRAHSEWKTHPPGRAGMRDHTAQPRTIRRNPSA
ncbi:MAG: hypothetical protein ACT4OX_03280 [Actinomycetota bacterium]